MPVRKVNTLIPPSGDKPMDGTILPSEDARWNIGSPSLRVNKLYVKEILADSLTGSSTASDVGTIVDADTVDGIHASAAPTANYLYPLNSNAVFPSTVYADAILRDGSRTLTGQLESVVTAGTAPFVVASTTLVTNLNADYLDGYHASEFVINYTAPNLTFGTSNVEGFADSVIRSDATIAIFNDGANPESIDPNDSAVVGTDAYAARRDHQHAISVGTPSTVEVQTNDPGSSGSFSRADHLHNVSTAAPGADSVNVSASGPGSASSLARSDHTHNLDEAIAPTWTGNHIWSGTSAVRFNQTTETIYSSGTGQLDIDANTYLELYAPTIELDASTRVYIPSGPLDLAGTLEFQGAQSIETTSGGDLTLAPDGDLVLNPTGSNVRLDDADDIRSDSWSSQTTGWRITGSGSADFRYLFADELHAKSFIADLEQALAGGQIIAKSVSILSSSFDAPYYGDIIGVNTTADYFVVSGDQTSHISAADKFVVEGSTGNDGTWTVTSRIYSSPNTNIYVLEDITNSAVDGHIGFQEDLVVDDLPSADNMAVFESGDFVGLRSFSRASGSLTISWCWGKVSGYTDGTGADEGTQTWTFTRLTQNGGTMAASTTVPADSIVLDFGTSGMGFHEVNAIDGLYGVNSPYAQVVTWATYPGNQTVRTRIGNIYGITGTSNEYGMFAGDGSALADAYVVASNQGVTLNNMDLAIYTGGGYVFKVDHTVPSLALGSTLPTGFGTGTNTGVWMGNDSGTYKWRVGNPDGQRVQWDGTALGIYSSSGTYMKTTASDLEFYANSIKTIELDGTTGDAYFGDQSKEHIWIDASVGIRMYGDSAGTLDERVRIETDGDLFLGNVDGYPRLFYDQDLGQLNIQGSSTEYVQVSSSGVFVYGSSNNHVDVTSSTVSMYGAGQKLIELNGSSGDVLLGQTGASQANMLWDYSEGQLLFRSGTTPQVFVDTDGIMKFGGSTWSDGTIELSRANGITVNASSNAWGRINYEVGGSLQGWQGASGDTGSGYLYLQARDYGTQTGVGVKLIAQKDTFTSDLVLWDSSSPYLQHIISGTTVWTSTTSGMDIEGGLAVGGTATPTADDIRADGDIYAASGLMLGNAGGGTVGKGIAIINPSSPYYGVALDMASVGSAWERGFYYNNGTTKIGGFGAYGGSTPSVSYYFVGAGYNDTSIRVFKNDATDYGGVVIGNTGSSGSIGAKLRVAQTSNTYNIPALRLDQSYVTRDFISFVGSAASANLTRSLVDDGDVTTEGAGGYLKIYIQDDGNQIADGYYYIPFVTIS